MSATIVMLTDFGLQDTYIGVMKGVIRGICPTVDVIDLTHAVQPQNVRQAALALLTSYRFFPAGSIFLVIVDPGVGSTRRPIAVRSGGYYFVAPDNGVLSYTLAESDAAVCVTLENRGLQLQALSNTFHGRDIFAPAAAHLAAGVTLEAFGPVLDSYHTLPQPSLIIESHEIIGEVIQIDHFGNIITSIGQWYWLEDAVVELRPRFGSSVVPLRLNAECLQVYVNDHLISGVFSTYSAVGRAELLALVSSSGFLEIAINQGHAARHLGVVIGDQIKVTW
jgi:S-adenosylmethionine hydrolase